MLLCTVQPWSPSWTMVFVPQPQRTTGYRGAGKAQKWTMRTTASTVKEQPPILGILSLGGGGTKQQKTFGRERIKGCKTMSHLEKETGIVHSLPCAMQEAEAIK